MITPPPKEDDKDRGDGADSTKCNDEDAPSEDPPPAKTPNWIFLYPKACARLLESAGASKNETRAGASVRSAGVFDIPPDTCQGGYYGNGLLDPETVLREGLPHRGDDWDLLNHVLQRGGSAFRGTTKQIVYPEDGVGAASFAGEDGIVYEVTCLPSWDVNKHLQGRVDDALGRKGGNTVLGEHEYAVASRIPTSHIKRYGRGVRSASGTLFVPRAAWVENPAWNPAFCRYSVSDYTSCEAMEVMMREMDADGDGMLSLDEFRLAMEKNGFMRSESESARTMLEDEDAALLTPEAIFRRFDVDDSNSISVEELRNLLMETTF